MRCLLVGGTNETAFLLNQTDYEISDCSLGEALTKIALNHPDCAIIDLNSAGLISREAISSFLRQLPQVLGQDQGCYYPILVGLVPHETRRDQQVKYYHMGFEVVIEAPIDRDLLVAQLKVLSRRIGIGNTITQSSHLMLNERTRDCFLKTKQGELLGFFKATPMQFDVLQLLAQNPRRVWSRDHLGDTLNNRISRFDRRAIDTTINRLRERFRAEIQKLPPNSWQINPLYKNPFIHTEYGSGYYFLDCLQLGKELRAARATLSPIRQGGLKIQPSNTHTFPFNIENCAYSWDSQG